MKWMLLLIPAILVPVILKADDAKLPDQVKRGRELFLTTAPKCGGCHALGSQGTAIGPDLSRLAALPPRALGMAILSTVTQYVEEATAKDGKVFPALKADTKDGVITLFDLSETPAVKKEMRAEDLSFKPNSKWKHPPATAGMSNEDVAAVIAYIKYVAKGDTREIDPSQVK